MSTRGRVLLVNPRITSRRHARFPLSIMTMAAALERRYDSTIVDGNMDRDAARSACEALGKEPFGGGEQPLASFSVVSPHVYPLHWADHTRVSS